MNPDRSHSPLREWRVIPAIFIAAVLWFGVVLPSEAEAQSRTSRSDIELDHSSTGFPLSGGHAQVVCERCHLQGIFRGTPMQCMQCHSPGGRVVSTFKPSNHLPTTVNCNSCHRTTSWKPAFFTHNGVVPGTCSRCHNQTTAVGKPATHIPTTMSCDSCHRTVGWTGAAFKHTGVGAGTCVTCHNGTTALGKPATHFPTTSGCETCHKSTTAFGPGTPMNHAGIVVGCATCHSGGYAGVVSKPANHVATTAACETCHKSTTSFAGAAFSHTGIVTGCATCHNGTTALGKPATHFPTTSGCETCHKSTTTFSGTRMVHSGVVVTGSCATCHERGMNWVGGIVTRPNDHNGTKAAPNSCDKSGCHNTSTFNK